MPCILSRSIIGPFTGDTGAPVELIPPRPPLTKGQGSPPLRRPPWVTPSPFPVRFQPSGACSWASRVGSCTQAGSPRLTSPEDRGQAPSGGSDVIGRELRQGGEGEARGRGPLLLT